MVVMLFHLQTVVEELYLQCLLFKALYQQDYCCLHLLPLGLTSVSVCESSMCLHLCLHARSMHVPEVWIPT